uniref:G-protein coupled receptors family 1 profile domain-containing protein n=1 Tax=Meloidogyne javanica TaxID=6303 RepID=A0A915N9R0_MELJA
MECGPNEATLFNFENNSTRQFIHSLVLFQKAYAPIHGRICVFLCLFGVITNLIHCVVLTRPQMRQSAVNSIMTAVALCDLATLWLAVLMAFLRRMTLHRNTLYSKWQRVALARRASLTVIFIILLLCIPSLAVHQVIPCLLLLILSASLLQRLKQAEKKRCQLLLKQLLSDSPKNDGRNSVDNLKQRGGIKKMHADRTTGLLLAILCVFLLTELPQGLIAILNAIYTADVHRFIYLTLGDVLDLLSLINSSVNFVLYCLMSSRYRQTFCSLFLPIKICGSCVANGGQSAPPLQSFVSEKQFNDNCDEQEIKGTLVQRLAQRRRSTPTLRLQRIGSQQSHLSMRDWKERQQHQRRGSNFPKYLGEKIKEDSNDENKHQTNLQHLLTPNAGF